MQCILHAILAPLKCLGDDQRLFEFDISQPAQFTEAADYGGALKTIQAAPHPIRFKQDGLGGAN